MAVLALATVTIRARNSIGPPLAGRTVVVHTRRPDDQSLRGVLVAQHADRLTLRDVVYLHLSGEQEVGGMVHIPLGAVSFVQEIEAPST